MNKPLWFGAVLTLFVLLAALANGAPAGVLLSIIVVLLILGVSATVGVRLGKKIMPDPPSNEDASESDSATS